MKTMVVLSGGMDSATALWHARNNANEVMALSVRYGQRHSRELDCAVLLADEMGCAHEIVDLSDLGTHMPGSSQTDGAVPVPHGHYADDNMKLTVVPNRNMILIATAAGVALAHGCELLMYGAHAGDHAIYPDCRPEFVKAMQEALKLCHFDGGIQLSSPFQGMDKGDIAIRGIELGVPFQLTHTCYEGTEVACGQCGACQERIEAFQKAKVIDPVKYASDVNWDGCSEFTYKGVTY